MEGPGFEHGILVSAMYAVPNTVALTTRPRHLRTCLPVFFYRSIQPMNLHFKSFFCSKDIGLVSFRWLGHLLRLQALNPRRWHECKKIRPKPVPIYLYIIVLQKPGLVYHGSLCLVGVVLN